MPELISFETAPEPVVTGETWTATAEFSEPLQDDDTATLVATLDRPPWLESATEFPVGTATPTVEVEVPADASTELYEPRFFVSLNGSLLGDFNRDITVIGARDRFPLRAQKAAESVRAADADQSRRAAVAAQAQRATAAAQSLRATIRPDER